MTPQTQTMLLTYMFALCLRIDDYATDTEGIAHDLGMPPARLVACTSGLWLSQTDGCASVSTVSSSRLVRLLAVYSALVPTAASILADSAYWASRETPNGSAIHSCPDYSRSQRAVFACGDFALFFTTGTLWHGMGEITK